MSAPQTLGGPSRCGRVLGPSLDKIVKNAAWRKHSHIVSSCKSALDKLDTLSDSALSDPSSPLLGLSSSDADFVLNPILLALDSNYAKLADPALESLFKLFSLGLFRGEIESNIPNSILYKIVQSVCKVGGIGDESIELAVLRVLLSAVRCPCVLIRGDCLLHVIRTCYNVYLSALNGTNQVCAKSVLAQIVLIVFTRAEEDSMDVSTKTVPVSELLEFTDKNLNEGSSVYYCQNFVSEVVNASEGVPDLKFSLPITGPELQNGESKVSNVEEKDGVEEEETKEGVESSSDGVTSKIREDGFLVFKYLCKLSMKFSSQENPDDEILLRGKTVSLELLKVIMNNGGSIWHTNERFLNAIKQYLCLSLLKNSALSVMSIFQLLCSIFMSLITKYRSGLKAEIGIFFPMLILRVLENILQPSFVQKMTVLNLLEKVVGDPQIIIDIFVNYDCDVDSPNIFERIVNGLLKTALGPPSGSTTTLSAVQDVTFRHESVKCLVGIIKSMGAWMDGQLKIGHSDSPKRFENDTSAESHSTSTAEDGTLADCELHPEMNSELSDAATVEQRRAYKIELLKGVSLFNRKPSKGIEFLINTRKVGNTPEEVASFLKKNTTGLNETMIGDYLGEREEFALKVMHAYVDSFNFKSMDFGEAIRFFLRGFRLPGEAQKIDRIMEKFAERYCKCNPNSFTSADTAYVLAYSVIMLNTDAHNNMVKDKMTKSDFIRNNRGINDGKDLPEEYLGALYDQIVKNEIKMNADSSVPQSKQENSLNKLLGLDGILNLVSWKQTEDKPLGANGLLIRHIQEQFKAKSGKSESAYHVVSDISILRFMVEVCWGPMLAAFSVTLDQSDDRLATTHCLLGFRHAVHVTAVLGMQTQRDAFVTSVAKFTFLHCAADMKQKNVDAVKAIISIAIEDGNHLQEAWEHILTCLSRIEHLQLLGEGAPTDASFLSVSNTETDEKMAKSAGLQSLKSKGTLQNLAVMAVVRGGSYDSASVGVNNSGLVSPEQINHFIANLNLLEQIGSFELNHVFAHSQRLNSEAIVAFVKALCKVSISELQSPTDPRVFSLTKLVEMARLSSSFIFSFFLQVALFATCCRGESKKQQHQLPKKHVPFLIFGDSILDAGNNNYINTSTLDQANFWPYGLTFFNYPTGRFCDGRLIPDFIAKYAKLPLIPPFLQPGFRQYYLGVNFASAGAGALVETFQGFVIDLKTQLRYYYKVDSWLRHKLGNDEAKATMSRAVHLFSIGTNDYASPFLTNSTILNNYNKSTYVGMVIGNLTTVIDGIYKRGGRKFAFINLPDLGCVPGIRIIKSGNNGSCFEEATRLASLHNKALSKLLYELEKRLKGFKYSLFDLNSNLRQRMEHPSKYGFKEGETACCGTGEYRGVLSCGGKRPVKEFQLCKHPQKYVFWDSLHLTERTYKQLADQMWGGTTSDSNDVGPYNIKQLFRIH